MVRTLKTPESIVDSIMSYEEKSAIIALLIGYQRSGVDWDIYFKKSDPVLMGKWKEVMKECHHSGFVHPKVENSILVWKVILSRHNELNDKCTACTESFTAGSCKGSLKIDHKDNMRKFVPCWDIPYEPIDSVPF
jgi:hypothetical protein